MPLASTTYMTSTRLYKFRNMFVACNRACYNRIYMTSISLSQIIIYDMALLVGDVTLPSLGTNKPLCSVKTDINLRII